MDVIELTAFRVDCILGILEREQREPQPLDIEIRMGLDLGPAGDGDALDRSVNYAEVMAQVTALVSEARFRLLETMGLAIARLILAPPAPGERRARVETVQITLRKPEVLGGAAIPGVVMARDRAWCDLRTRSFGEGVLLDVLAENGHDGAYRLHLDRGASLVLPASLSLHVVTGDIEAEGPVLPGQTLRRGTVAQVRNVGQGTACLLGMAVPALSA